MSFRFHIAANLAFIIYKRGDLKDLFPQLGLHARIKAQMKRRSVALVNTCLLDTTASTVSSNSLEDDGNAAKMGKESGTTEADATIRATGRVTGEKNSDKKLKKLVRDWFERTKRKATCFLNEHRCS